MLDLGAECGLSLGAVLGFDGCGEKFGQDVEDRRHHRPARA